MGLVKDGPEVKTMKAKKKKKLAMCSWRQDFIIANGEGWQEKV